MSFEEFSLQYDGTSKRHRVAVVGSKSRCALTVSTQMIVTSASFLSVAMLRIDTWNFKEPFVSIAVMVSVGFLGRSSPKNRNNSSIGRWVLSSVMDVRVKHFAPCASRSKVLQ